MSRLGRRRRLHRREAGVSITEAIVSLAIATLVLTGVFMVTANVATSNDRRATRQPLEDNARASLDEMISQLRAGYNVSAAPITVGTKILTTGPNCIVFTAPAFNPSQSGIFSTYSTTQDSDMPNLDTISFNLDTASGKLYETIQTYAGSARPQRNQFVAARNVSAFSYAFRVTEVYLSNNKSPLTWTHAMNSAWLGTNNPVCTITVNGADVTSSCNVTYNASTHSATAQLPQGNATLVFRYPVDPSNATAYPNVTEIIPSLTFQAKDSRQNSQSVTFSGVARLRNERTIPAQT